MSTAQQPATAAAPPVLPPWENPAQFVEKPADARDHGYMDEQGTHACTREELVARFGNDAPVYGVWTPETPRLVVPEDVPFLHDAITRQEQAAARRKVMLSGIVFLGALGYLLYRGYWRIPWRWEFLVTGMAAIWLGAQVLRLVTARRLTPERILERGSDTRHAYWLGAQPHQATRWISWCLVAVFACQYFSGLDRSAEAAGLVKSMVRLGEPWRLLTGPMLHGGVLHFLFNYGALLAFGRMVEAHAGRPYLPLVFIVSALGGSVLSTMLVRGTSVGASGGLLGLLGFLLMLATRRRALLPPGFLRTIWIDIAGVVALGIFGFALIDNAGHLGGFLTGVALGALLVPRADGALPAAAAVPAEPAAARPWSLAPGPGVRLAGDIALAATTGAAVMAIAAMFGWWQ